MNGSMNRLFRYISKLSPIGNLWGFFSLTKDILRIQNQLSLLPLQFDLDWPPFWLKMTGLQWVKEFIVSVPYYFTPSARYEEAATLNVNTLYSDRCCVAACSPSILFFSVDLRHSGGISDAGIQCCCGVRADYGSTSTHRKGVYRPLTSLWTPPPQGPDVRLPKIVTLRRCSEGCDWSAH